MLAIDLLLSTLALPLYLADKHPLADGEAGREGRGPPEAQRHPSAADPGGAALPRTQLQNRDQDRRYSSKTSFVPQHRCGPGQQQKENRHFELNGSRVPCWWLQRGVPA